MNIIKYLPLMNHIKYLPKINISKYLPNINHINLNLLLEPTDNWRIQGFYLDKINKEINQINLGNKVHYHKQCESRDFNINIDNKVIKNIPRNQQYEYRDF